MPKPTIEIETFIRPCRTFGCYNQAKYKIGNMSGSPIAYHHVCEKCLISIIKSIPEEFIQAFATNNQREKIDEEVQVTKTKESPIAEELTERFVEHMENMEKEDEFPLELSYKEMQKILKDEGLKATGTKEELTERYEEYLKGELND